MSGRTIMRQMANNPESYQKPSDKFFEFWLEQSPDIYQNILLQERQRNRQEKILLYRLADNPLSLDMNKYDDFKLTSQYPMISNNSIYYYLANGKAVSIVLNNNPQKSVITGLSKIPGVAICGGYVNGLIMKNNKYETKNNEIIDIDLFLFGNGNIANRVKSIVEYIFNNIKNIYDQADLTEINIFDSENAITIKLLYTQGPRYSKTYQFQIIKRVYDDVGSILVGFDLDSVSVAIVNDEFFYHPRYQMAVRYGINVINPSRQSKTYNHRLYKYTYRGFFPFLAGALHRKNISYKEKFFDPSSKYSYHGISYLIAKVFGRNNMTMIDKKEVSDYIGYDFSKGPGIEKIRRGEVKVNRRIYFWNNSNKPMQEQDVSKFTHIVKEYGKNFAINTNDWDLGYMQIFRQLSKEEKELLMDVYENSMTFDIANILYMMDKTGTLLDWKYVDPGTQISGSFNPLSYDYFSL